MKTIKQYLMYLTIACFSINAFGQCVDSPTDLVSWWTGDNNSQDLYGTNHGIQQGGVSYVTGVVDNAFYFDGVDDLIVVPSSANLDITGDVTIELWVRRVGYSNTSQTVLCKGAGYIPNDAPVVFSMRFENDLTEFLFEDIIGNNIIINGPAYEDSQWHHYAYVREGNVHRVYADGFSFGDNTFTNSPASTVGLPLTMGAQYHNPTSSPNDYSNFFNGEVDEVGVYNRALSEAEIQSIYNAGTLGKCKGSLSVEDNLLSENQIGIYPNPISETAVIQLNYSVQNASLIVYNINGREIKRQTGLNGKNILLNRDDLNSGMYIVNFQHKNSSSIIKVVLK